MRFVSLMFITFIFSQTISASAFVSQNELNLQKIFYSILSLDTRSQMLMKDYILTVQGLKYANPEANLDDEIEDQNDEFDMINVGQVDPSLKANETKLRQQWAKISKFVTKKKSIESAVKLYKLIDSFDSNCMSLAKSLFKHSVQPALKYAFDLQTIDQYTQRASTLYEMRILRVMDENKIHKEISQLLDNMIAQVDDLKKSPSSLFPVKLKKELKNIDKTFYLYKIMVLSRSKHFIPALISQKSNEMDMILRNIVEEHQVIAQHKQGQR